jgi:hypothetical protein
MPVLLFYLQAIIIDLLLLVVILLRRLAFCLLSLIVNSLSFGIQLTSLSSLDWVFKIVFRDDWFKIEVVSRLSKLTKTKGKGFDSYKTRPKRSLSSCLEFELIKRFNFGGV